MTALQPYTKLMRGTKAVPVFTKAATKWPIKHFKPTDLAGLVTWLDALDYLPGSWPNKGSGPAVAFINPNPPQFSTQTLNGKPLVRFRKDQGALRSAWPYGGHDWTLVYLVRWVGPTAGRAFSVQYPPSNFLVGMHTTRMDAAYMNGVWFYGPNAAWQSVWRMYGADSDAIGGSRFLIDGVSMGAPYSEEYGLMGGWGLSGYEASTSETLDIEVAELVLFNRKLPDAERQQVENYLQEKWAPT